MMEQGTTFSDVEDVIDASELSTVHKAALWLLVPSHQPFPSGLKSPGGESVVRALFGYWPGATRTSHV